MESIGNRASARHSGTRAALLLGTALGCVGYAAPAGAQNIVSYGTTDYSLTRSERTDGGPRTIDISTSGGNITLDLGEVTSVNNGTGYGTAIGANNFGPGAVSIRTTSAIVTGSGRSDAINAGTVQANTGSNSGIVANSTTGPITITAADVSGRYGTSAQSFESYTNLDIVYGGILDLYSPQECGNYLVKAEYDADRSETALMHLNHGSMPRMMMPATLSAAAEKSALVNRALPIVFFTCGSKSA